MSSELDPGEIRAAAAVHHELGPEFRDAVVESFLEKVDRHVAARIEQAVSAPAVRQAEPAAAYGKRMLVTGVLIGVFITGIPAVMVAASSGGGSAVARDETNLLFLLMLVAVVISVAALAGNRHRSRRGSAPDR
jgi:hypothetical protein